MQVETLKRKARKPKKFPSGNTKEKRSMFLINGDIELSHSRPYSRKKKTRWVKSNETRMTQAAFEWRIE